MYLPYICNGREAIFVGKNMATPESGILKAASGSYCADLYSEDSGSGGTAIGFKPRKHDAGYRGGFFGPECLLVGDYAGSSYQYLHTQWAYDQWRTGQEGKAR